MVVVTLLKKKKKVIDIKDLFHLFLGTLKCQVLNVKYVFLIYYLWRAGIQHTKFGHRYHSYILIDRIVPYEKYLSVQESSGSKYRVSSILMYIFLINYLKKEKKKKKKDRFCMQKVK